MTEIKQYKISFATVKGDQVEIIQAFSRQQAKRKLLTHVSNKREHPTIKKIELVFNA